MKTYPGMKCGSDDTSVKAEVTLKWEKIQEPNRWYLGNNDVY